MIPAHWEVARVGDHVKLVNGFPFKSEFFDLFNGTPLVRIRDLDSEETEVLYDGPIEEDAWIDTGDIIIGMDGDYNVARWRGKRALLNQRMCSLRPLDSTDVRFLRYFLPYPLDIINDLTYSTTVKHLSSAQVRKILFGAPSLIEQQAIADFLDRETAKIDTLVEKKERLIELLREKRTALITHAVTKGLNPDVPMKDSGIEWLGQIPDHWEKLRTQDCANLAVGLAFPSDSFLHGESDVGIKLVRGDNVTTGALRWGERTRRWPSITSDISHLLLEENDIVIGMDGSKVGRNYALVRSEDLPLLLVQRVARLRPKQRTSAKYLFFSIANPRFHMHVDLEKSDPAIPHVTGLAIAHYPVFLPSLEEQDAIIAYVERETAKIDTLISKIQEAIGRLKEYRTALISAAVTGKIDVRNK